MRAKDNDEYSSSHPSERQPTNYNVGGKYVIPQNQVPGSFQSHYISGSEGPYPESKFNF